MEFSEFSSLLLSLLEKNNLSVPDETAFRKLHAFSGRLSEANKIMNLTAIRDEREALLLHFVDSLTVSPFLPAGARVLDVGCGAGFPCLPLAIARPDLSLFAIDSTEKKLSFVKGCADFLALDNFRARACRAEELAHNPAFRERFDAVTARAVAALPQLCELCLPLVRVGGAFLAMKSKKGDEELSQARNAIHTLGGAVTLKHVFQLADGEQKEDRMLIRIAKTAPTPAIYPRPWGKISKSPL